MFFSRFLNFVGRLTSSVCPHIHPSIHPPTSQSIHPPIYLSINLPTHQSILPSTHPSTHLPSHPSIHPPIYLSIHLSICLSQFYMLACLTRHHLFFVSALLLNLKGFIALPSVIFSLFFRPLPNSSHW